MVDVGAGTVVVSVVVTSLVGRTGGDAVAVVVVGSGHSASPHSLSVWQHPPPRDAGHVLNAEAQVNVAGGELVTVTVRVTVTITGGRVDVLVETDVWVLEVVLVVEEVEVVERDGVIVV